MLKSTVTKTEDGLNLVSITEEKPKAEKKNLINNYLNAINRLAERSVDIYPEDGSLEDAVKTYTKMAQDALDSYPAGVKIIRCTRCGIPMTFESLAYMEGYHFDSCL